MALLTVLGSTFTSGMQVQTSWGGSGRGNFLHSPLLDELQALEAAAGRRDMVSSRAGVATVAEQTPGEPGANKTPVIFHTLLPQPYLFPLL